MSKLFPRIGMSTVGPSSHTRRTNAVWSFAIEIPSRPTRPSLATSETVGVGSPIRFLSDEVSNKRVRTTSPSTKSSSPTAVGSACKAGDSRTAFVLRYVMTKEPWDEGNPVSPPWKYRVRR